MALITVIKLTTLKYLIKIYIFSPMFTFGGLSGGGYSISETERWLKILSNL